MTRLQRARVGARCGSRLLSRGGCEVDAQSSGEPGEIVRPPAVTAGDRECDRLRVTMDWQMAGAADEPSAQFVCVQFVEQYVEERPRPGHCRSAFGEEPKETRANRTAPVFQVS